MYKRGGGYRAKLCVCLAQKKKKSMNLYYVNIIKMYIIFCSSVINLVNNMFFTFLQAFHVSNCNVLFTKCTSNVTTLVYSVWIRI